MMNLKFAMLIIIGLVGYLVWGFMAYFDETLRHDFLAFNIAMASGTIGIVVRDMKSSSDTPPISPPVTPTAPTYISKE